MDATVFPAIMGNSKLKKMLKHELLTTTFNQLEGFIV